MIRKNTIVHPNQFKRQLVLVFTQTAHAETHAPGERFTHEAALGD